MESPARLATQSVVSLRGVTKRFGRHVAVDALDLEVPPGICFGLLGPNGAGKTTALRMIYGVARPSAGSVRVFGRDVQREPRAVRARLGVTLQENVQIEELSAVENLRIFGRYHLIAEPRLSQRVAALLDFLGLRSHAELPVAALSGGFRRRLSIAMSLMNEPELLVLDEPTTGLDPAVRLALWSRIRELRAGGTSVLLTTHYMDEAERLCDRVVIMSAGRAVADGSPRELISRYVPPQAVELDCTEDEEARLLRDAGGTWQRMRAGSRLVIYAHDAAEVVRQLERLDGGSRRPRVIRPSNLEDVFLAATGSGIQEPA